jgi:cytochrome c oxidase subunit 3
MINNDKNIKNSKLFRAEQHPFHLVDPSPWPFFTSMFLLNNILWIINFLHSIVFNCPFFHVMKWVSIVMFFASIVFWFNDIVIEATFEGKHTIAVRRGLQIGMVLFIASEIMLFFSFFWAYFHFSLNPSVFVGNVWPYPGIKPFNAWHIPFLNTIILLASGVAVTWAHKAIIGPEDKSINIDEPINYRSESLNALMLTIALGVLFTLLQRYEYIHAPFNISDGVYGSTFYTTTGLHGLHVLLGTGFLFVCLLRHINYHFTREHHFGLEAAIWYWHFVDVVWLFVFVSIYYWGAGDWFTVIDTDTLVNFTATK